MTREPGNLLEAVWIDIFRRKGSVQCTAPFVDGGSVHVYLGLVLFGERVPFCGDIEHVKQTKENANMKKVLSLLLALVCILSLTACGGGGTPDDSAAPSPESNQPDTQPSSGPGDGQKPAAPGDSHYPVTITNYDYEGNPVEYTYEKAPERVICVYQGCVETMIALGLEDHVLASYGLDNEVKAEWRAGFEKMHYDASVFAPDKETVTLLEPDMIFSWDSYFGEKKLGDVYDWNQKGVATYISANSGAAKTRTLENEYNDILNIGRIFDVEEKAEALVDGMKRQVADALAAVQGQEAVRVAVLEPISGKITNYAADSLAGDMVLQLGGELVKPEGSEMGKEDLVACDPDVIFVVYMAYSGDDPETVKAQQLSIIQDDPAFASLSAVQSGRVHLIMLGDMYASGPRTGDGIQALAQGMYPQLAG